MFATPSNRFVCNLTPNSCMVSFVWGCKVCIFRCTWVNNFDNNFKIILDKMIKKNRHYIQAVSDVLLTCCKQDIAICGHRETDESTNRGNFMELVTLLSRYDSVVCDRLRKGPRNSLYTSHGIQNTIISIMGSIVRQQICTSVQRAGYFSVLVDETKDLSKNEQMSISVRYLDPDTPTIRERFLSFVFAPSLTADHLSQYIVSTLSLFNLNLSSIVSQGYDGAAVMSGCASGVQKRIRELAPQAIYVHCHAHCLNLVLVDCVKSLTQASDFFAVVQSLYVFMSANKAHTVFIKQQSVLHPDKQPRELQRLSDTRWACRYTSLDAVCSTFDCILSALEIIGEGDDKSKAIEAVGLYHHIHSFQFISCLVIFTRVMSFTKSLSDHLQSRDLDLVSAADLVTSTMQILKELRTDEKWEHTFKYINDVAALHDIEIEERRRRRRPRPAVRDDYVTESTLGHRDPLNTSQSLKLDVYFPVLDHILSEMERRFSERNLEIMKGLQACSPKSSHFLDFSELDALSKFYGLSGDGLFSTECVLAKRCLTDKNPETVMDVYSHLLPLQSAFPTLYKLIRIALTIAVSTAHCERTFSALKRIKTYLRTTMGEQRLSDIALLSIERDLSNSISFDDVIERFEGSDKNRTIILF